MYAGASKPFCRPAASAPDIHGESGLGVFLIWIGFLVVWITDADCVRWYYCSA